MTQPDNRRPFSPGSFAEVLGIEQVESGDGWARLRMPIRVYHLQGSNVVQGGVIMTLADSAFWRAVATLLSPGQSAATSELKVNFIKPGRGAFLIALGRVIHKGRRLMVGEADITDAQGDLVAKALGTFVVLDPP